MSSNNNNLDEAIVSALQFANMVLLEKSFNLINWSQLAAIPQSNKPKTNLYDINLQSAQTSQKPKHTHQTKSSKFQKVIPSIKSKSQASQSNASFSQAQTIVTNHNTTNNTKIKQPISLQSYIYSKVQTPSNKLINDTIYEQQNHELSLSTFPGEVITHNNINPQPVNQWLTGKSAYNYDSSSSFVKGSSLQQSAYTVNDFLKQTSVSLSRNLYHQQQQSSPITAWDNTGHNNNKVSSVEKMDDQRKKDIQKKDVSPFKAITLDNKSIGKNNSNEHEIKASSNVKKSKFQKTNTKQTTSKSLKQTQQDSLKPSFLQQTPNNPKKNQSPQPQVISRQYQYVIPSQKQYDHEAQSRATCELAPSKLQQLMEVQDNKYKEIVLKTYFKHQK